MGSTGGWNRPISNQPKKKGGAKAPSMWKGVAAGLAIAVPLIILCIWIFDGHEESGMKPIVKERGRIKAVKPAKAAVVVPKKNENADEADTLSPREKKSKAWREMLLKEAEHNPQLMFHLTNGLANAVKPTFPSSVEQAMDWIFNCVPGDNPMPLPGLSEEDPGVIASALVSFNEIADEDTEDVAFRKESVMLAKKELRQFIKDGGDYPDFMDFYRNQLVQYHKLWVDAQTSIETAPPDLNQEEMTRLVEKTNEMLSEKGIKPIEMNEVVRERLGLPDPEDEDQSQTTEGKNE